MTTNFIQHVSTKATFSGGTEHGKTRDVWATKQLVVVVQPPPVASAAEVAKMDFKALMSTSYPKPQRQIYELARTGTSLQGPTAEYRLLRVETP